MSSERQTASISESDHSDDTLTTPPIISSKPKWWHYFIAGELAGMVGSILCHPFDTTKTRVQMLSQHNESTFSFMRSVVAKEGIGALYRGVLYPFCGFGILF